MSWILFYGAHAEALEPPELRREVKRQIKEMGEFYCGKEKGQEKKIRKSS